MSYQSEWSSSQNLYTTNAGEGMEKREPPCTVGGNVNLYSHYGGSLKKLKIELSCDPAFPLLGTYPEKKHNSKIHMHPNVHCSTIYNSQVRETI